MILRSGWIACGVCVIVGAALSPFSGCVSGGLLRGTLRLADGGKPLADIVIAPDAGESIKFTATELKEHLDKITGGDFAIVNSPREGKKQLAISFAPGLAKQEVRISFSDSGVALESGEHPEYAVYDFLWDYCGVRWLDPTDSGTVIPSKPNLAVSRRDRTDRPFAKGRNPIGAYSSTLWTRGSPGWTNYLHVAYPSAFTNATFAAAEEEIARRSVLFLRRMKSGGEVANACHSFYWWYDRFWDKGNPRFERFEPGFFAQGYDDQEEPPQLCYSNPAVIRQTIADVRDYFDNGGYKSSYRGIGGPGPKWGKDTYCLEPMDNDTYCKCDKCASQYRPDVIHLDAEHSDYWFRFVNAVAKEVAKSHPGKKISTLAYYSHTGVPTFKLEPNVVVHFCFFCNRMPYSKRSKLELMWLNKWREEYPGRPFGLWLYNTYPKECADRYTFVNCFPGFFAGALGAEYALFDELDISENIYNCGFVDDYENYLSLRWMWNPRESLKTLEDDYFSSYGKAARPIRKFYRIVEERYCNPLNYPQWFLKDQHHQTITIAWKVLGTREVMSYLESLMLEAERLADTPQAKARVANWRAGVFEYMCAGEIDGHMRIRLGK